MGKAKEWAFFAVGVIIVMAIVSRVPFIKNLVNPAAS